MLDIGFSELLLIAVVGLLVIGPKDLPVVMRHVMKFLRDVDLEDKAKNYVEDLSGGQKQRLSITTALVHGPKVFFLDEPTTGLHFEDVKILMDAINQLVELGNSFIIIEHNMDVIKLADHIIDVGPEGGKHGGQIVAQGTPEEIVKSKKSLTGKFLKREFE